MRCTTSVVTELVHPSLIDGNNNYFCIFMLTHACTYGSMITNQLKNCASLSQAINRSHTHYLVGKITNITVNLLYNSNIFVFMLL